MIENHNSNAKPDSTGKSCTPRFIRLTGRAGSGKTTWAMQHARKLGKDQRLFIVDSRSGYEQLQTGASANHGPLTFFFDVSKGVSGDQIERVIISALIDDKSTLIIDEFPYVAQAVGEDRLREIMSQILLARGSIVVSDQSENRSFLDSFESNVEDLCATKEHIRL